MARTHSSTLLISIPILQTPKKKAEISEFKDLNVFVIYLVCTDKINIVLLFSLSEYQVQIIITALLLGLPFLAMFLVIRVYATIILQGTHLCEV